MTRPAPEGRTTCSVLVLGEDSGDHARETLETIAKKSFRLLVRDYNDRKIRFEPPQGPGVRLLRGNLWKSRNPRDEQDRRHLIAYVGTKLLEGDHSFVLWHIDGDRPWSAREESENLQKFQAFIQEDVRRFVEHRLSHSKDGPSPAIRTSQLLRMVPFYSLEAWLFQNTEEGIRLCRAHGQCRGGHVGQFERWGRDPGALDEEGAPKSLVCFENKHNHLLAGPGFRAETLYNAGKSFTTMIDAWLESDSLCAALSSTRDVRRPPNAGV